MESQPVKASSITKVCTKCNNVGEHHVIKSGARAGKAQTRCKECSNRYHREQHAKGKSPYHRNKRIITEYLEDHPCMDCHITDVRVLCFDHVRGKKEFSIRAAAGHSLKRVLAEIAKCDVRCSNCHLIRHHEYRALAATVS